MRSSLALSTLRARIWIGLLRISKPITASRQEPIWSVQLPYRVCETAFSQVGLFLD